MNENLAYMQKSDFKMPGFITCFFCSVKPFRKLFRQKLTIRLRTRKSYPVIKEFVCVFSNGFLLFAKFFLRVPFPFLNDK